MIVVDDRLLFDVLAGTELSEFGEFAKAGIATTFSWYYRLARAISSGRIDGSLSRAFAELTDDRRRYVQGLLDHLPEYLEILHPRELVPTMSALMALTSVNFITAEVIATSMILEAEIVVTTTSPLLNRAARLAGVECRFFPRP